MTLPLIVWYLDDPVADPALVPLYFIAREARKHVKVVLSGEGADELFGGYTIYREPISLRAFDYLPAGVRRGLGAMSTRLPEGMRGKDLLRRGSIGIEERYYGNARIFRPDEMPKSAAPIDPATSVHGRHPRRCTQRPSTSTARPGCSTSTCSPGCAATSSSRPTR